MCVSDTDSPDLNIGVTNICLFHCGKKFLNILANGFEMQCVAFFSSEWHYAVHTTSSVS